MPGPVWVCRCVREFGASVGRRELESVCEGGGVDGGMEYRFDVARVRARRVVVGGGKS